MVVAFHALSNTEKWLLLIACFVPGIILENMYENFTQPMRYLVMFCCIFRKTQVTVVSNIGPDHIAMN